MPFHVAKLQVDFWQLMRSQHFPVRDADVSYAIGLLMKSGWWFQIASVSYSSSQFAVMNRSWRVTYHTSFV